jgi:hypothetical protein
MFCISAAISGDACTLLISSDSRLTIAASFVVEVIQGRIESREPEVNPAARV